MTLDEADRLNQSIRALSFMDQQAAQLKAAIDAEVAKEREACAKIVEDLMSEDRSTLYDISALQVLADRIRDQ